MMYNYPFFSFPTFRNYNYYPNNKIIPNNYKSEVRPISNSSNNLGHLNFNNTSRLNVSTSNKHNILNDYKTNTHKSKDVYKKSIKNESNALLELFGIKLYFDDILLISLIFFLYSEGVKDDYLFISLILLLLS